MNTDRFADSLERTRWEMYVGMASLNPRAHTIITGITGDGPYDGTGPSVIITEAGRRMLLSRYTLGLRELARDRRRRAR